MLLLIQSSKESKNTYDINKHLYQQFNITDVLSIIIVELVLFRHVQGILSKK